MFFNENTPTIIMRKYKEKDYQKKVGKGKNKQQNNATEKYSLKMLAINRENKIKTKIITRKKDIVIWMHG